MDLTIALRVVAGWAPFNELPQKHQAQLAEALQPLKLRPGQKLYDHGSLPPGVAYVVKGQLRLLARDENGEPFTIQRVGPAGMVGERALLRGEPGLALQASLPTQLWLLPAQAFLGAVDALPKPCPALASPTLEELYGAIAASGRANLPPRQALRDWASNQLHDYRGEQQVMLLPPGSHTLPSGCGHWLVSSTNFEGLEPGAEIEGPVELFVRGRLSGRLVAQPAGWPPGRMPVAMVVGGDLEPDGEVLEPEWIESPGSIVPAQSDALEDWYGRLSDDGSFPHVKGQGPIDEPMACLRMLARFFDLPFRKDVLRRILADQLQREGEAGIGLLQLAAVSDLMGLRASILEVSATQLQRLPCPVLVMQEGHPQLIWQVGVGDALIGDPTSSQERRGLDTLVGFNDEGKLQVLAVERSATTPTARFGLGWFVPALMQHRTILIQVLVASFFVQLFALLNPLLIQQIIDAVITQGNLSSLNVLGTLLVGMAVAQAVLGALRTYLFSDTTNRIDITLGATIIDHLLRLPLGYFARRPVGEVSSRINELEKIRRFLTGTALTVVLDAVFAIIYVAVMMLYSVSLTFWALAVVPFFIGLTAAAAPIIRAQLRDQAEANARVQSHLVETLSGMETVKGQGMELHSRWRWQQLYGGQIQAGFRNTLTSTAAGSASKFLEQLSGLLVLWVGASLVLKGELTLGQLIAFRILAGYVTSPLLRLATLWQNFQETSLSLERLSDIVDHPEEIEIAGEQLPPLPPVHGAIRYEAVNFRFGNQGPLQLLNVNFEIPAGSFVGIVGTSGSGKSTLLKLLTRLYDPLEGTIRLDGYDISKVDLYSLRAQIGVVPQDSLLFDGSVLANLALTRPDASFEDICRAAQVACAHDFIQAMPAGYSSSVGERGSGLSGGQRQRIAIARMVLKRPRLLIMDEATSALDVQTEKQVTRNLMEAYRGSTVLFITHRLGALRHADQILVMDQGSLVEQGSHEELMALNGRYALLYNQQEAALV
ncbi:MAG: peptidase domain-containing ABC transporter [Synechococcus sp. BS301-5m-G53]|nr:peptidase domain-containing ABC transporter [Synechococcus sp. BS301-5m-G53]